MHINLSVIYNVLFDWKMYIKIKSDLKINKKINNIIEKKVQN